MSSYFVCTRLFSLKTSVFAWRLGFSMLWVRSVMSCSDYMKLSVCESFTYAMFPELFDHSQAQDVGYLCVHRETGGQDVSILTNTHKLKRILEMTMNWILCEHEIHYYSIHSGYWTKNYGQHSSFSSVLWSFNTLYSPSGTEPLHLPPSLPP